MKEKEQSSQAESEEGKKIGNVGRRDDEAPHPSISQPPINREGNEEENTNNNAGGQKIGIITILRIPMIHFIYLHSLA